MSELINKNKLTPLLFLAPVIWMATGMLWDGDGDMRLVPIVLAITAISIFLFRFDVIKDNFKNSFWIKLLFINGFFGVIAYKIYGFDSRELRATLSICVLLLVTPKSLYTKKAMQWFLFVAAVSCALYGYYYQIHINYLRNDWPVNAIPFATICGLISISSISLIVSDFNGKNFLLLIFACFLSMTGLLLSQSRGPLIATIVIVSCLYLYVSYRKSKALTICVLISIFTFTWGISKLPVIQERIEVTIGEYNLIQQGDYGTSVGIRLQMLEIGVDLWKVRPLFGFGKDIKSEFDRLESEKRITPAVNRLISMTFHNGYMDKFVLYGVVGGIIFLTFIIYPIWKSKEFALEGGSSLLWAPALFVSICNLSDAPFINAQAAIYYMFIVGSVTMILSNEKEIV